MATLVFQDKATADSVLKEIAATPSGVIVWAGRPDPNFGFDAEVNIVGYAQSVDGRQAISYPFDEIDSDWLEAYTAGMAGVQVLDDWPGDWIPQSELS